MSNPIIGTSDTTGEIVIAMAFPIIIKIKNRLYVQMTIHTCILEKITQI